VLSSPDNIAYFKQMQSEGWVPSKLVDRMRANPGKVIPFNDPESASNIAITPLGDVSTPLPRNVAILIDGAVVSAGEAFVLKAMKNQKVKLFGQNTGGVVDYQSVTIVNLLACSSLGLYLGYPTSAASARLPVGGINATGIPPDVRIPLKIRDPIKFIIDYYRGKSTERYGR
jgi:C-terminal processing protease CtpA/Prc